MRRWKWKARITPANEKWEQRLANSREFCWERNARLSYLFGGGIAHTVVIFILRWFEKLLWNLEIKVGSFPYLAIPRCASLTLPLPSDPPPTRASIPPSLHPILHPLLPSDTSLSPFPSLHSRQHCDPTHILVLIKNSYQSCRPPGSEWSARVWKEWFREAATIGACENVKTLMHVQGFRCFRHALQKDTHQQRNMTVFFSHSNNKQGARGGSTVSIPQTTQIIRKYL